MLYPKYFIPGLLILFSFPALQAQERQVIFEQLNISEGLSHSLISACAEDPTGFMWFSTQDGINRYDGYSFKVYQPGRGPRFPSSSWINSIYMDRESQLWILYQGKGINRFDTRREMFYDYQADPSIPGSISDVQVQPLNSAIYKVFYEDVNNQLWIGTQTGLNLYLREEDKFRTYGRDGMVKVNFTNDQIQCITGDQEGRLWIGTRKGLNRYDPRSGECLHYTKTDENYTISDSIITCIFVENDSTIWIGTPLGGLNLLENPGVPGKQKISRYLNQSLIKNEEASINCIYKTRSGRILVGMIGGLYELKRGMDHFLPELIQETALQTIEGIIEAPDGTIWVSGSISKNLFRLNPELTRCDKVPLVTRSAIENKNIKAQFLYISRTGILWLGTEKDGIFKTDLNAKDFHLIGAYNQTEHRLNNKEIYAIYEDPNRQLYVGTKEGLSIINPATGEIHNYNKKEDNPKNINFTVSRQIPGDIVGVIEPQSDGRIWLGLFDYKTSLFNPADGSFLNFHHNPADPGAFKLWSLRSICVTRNNEVYFGGTTNGLARYIPESKKFSYLPINESEETGISGEWINCIYEDKEGILWIGTSLGGLTRYDPVRDTYRHFKHSPENRNSLSNNMIKSILEPAVHGKDILWIGTQGGLHKFDKITGSFETIDKTHGLPSNSIHGVLEDSRGNLWISSNKGLSCFDPVHYQVKNYSAEDGLQSDEFNEGAYFRNDRGIMYFGGVNGLTWFDPESLKDNPNDAIPVITGFNVFYRPVLPLDTIGKSVILEKNIYCLDRIELSHKERIFSFEFASLHFVSPKKSQFRYKLEGFEQNENLVDASQRFASYTNIPTGEYDFKVWATNSDGKWSASPASIHISILPPFWEQVWFKFILVGTVLVLFLSILRIRTTILKKQRENLKKLVEVRTMDLKKANDDLETHQAEIIFQNEKIARQRDDLKSKNETLEKQKEEIQNMAEKLHAADEQKLRFFTNISHEFRTPLTLILGPTENLLDRESYADTQKVKETLSLIHKNEKRLFRLINQLLEIRKIETGAMKLKVQEEDIVSFLRSIIELFEGIARKNNINLSLITETETLKFYFDADKIEKIIFNLLSNAFNHTPGGGAIIVFLDHIESVEKTWIRISVSDTGNGIPEKHLPYIFDRFYQFGTRSETGQISSGIGLSLCKDLIEHHKGKITVTSETGKGTTFDILLPVCTDCYEKEEFAEEPENSGQLNYSRSMLDIDYNGRASDQAGSEASRIDSFRTLVVEDDEDMQKYLSDELSADYHVNLASNGLEGLKMVQTQIPDLIISDIMMPVMDGYELCRQVKSNELTSHIPVILLTAKSGEENQIQGLSYGADDYITKPFNPGILKLKIRNILENRLILAKKFSSELDAIPSNLKISEIDHGFLEKMVKIIEDNIDDSNINGDRLASDLGVSKGNLYKKLKALTGLTVNIFIRNVRLKIAAKLLKRGNYSISEVAYAVGFNNPKYFSTCFSDLFGMSPKEYMQN